MPELPEVETIRSGLARHLPGKIIVDESHDWAKGFPNTENDVQEFLIGAKIQDIKRRAKVLIIELDTKYSLVIHLKMTGQLVFVGTGARFGAGHPNSSLIGELPDRSTRVILTFADGSKLFFNDQRKFGWMRLLPIAEIPNIDFIKRLGPEPLAESFSTKNFYHRVKRRQNSMIKAVLLDQSVIAGIGNIYADESLWLARIHPAQRVKDISDRKLNKLFASIQKTLSLAIENGGSSDRNYVNSDGKPGSYLRFAKVFRREGLPCMRHTDTLIVKIRVAGRGTHICPKCQKLAN